MTVSTRYLWLVAALAMLVAASGYAFWKAQKDKTTEAQLEAGVDGARLVETRFLGTADIRVGVFEGKALGTGTVKGRLLTATQRSLAPFTIDYFVALKKIDSSDYRWDAKSYTLTINIPDVWIASPNIDMTKAITRQTGVWISRTDGLSLNRQVATTMAAKIENGAMEDKNRNKAREAARLVVSGLARQILVAGGIADAKVAVSFPWEPKAADGQRWDRSRRPDVIMQDR